MDWWINIGIAIISYLLGMAFAGSFLGRKWMGTVDVFLHKVFKREVTASKYLYLKHLIYWHIMLLVFPINLLIIFALFQLPV